MKSAAACALACILITACVLIFCWTPQARTTRLAPTLVTTTLALSQAVEPWTQESSAPSVSEATERLIASNDSSASTSEAAASLQPMAALALVTEGTEVVDTSPSRGVEPPVKPSVVPPPADALLTTVGPTTSAAVVTSHALPSASMATPARKKREPDIQPAPRLVRGEIASGSTLAASLGAQGISRGLVHEIVDAFKPEYDFRRAPAGTSWELHLDGKAALQAFRFTPGKGEWRSIERDDTGALRTSHIEADLRVEEAEIAVAVRRSLHEAVKDAGESGVLASLIADVFAWDLDLSRDSRPGDVCRIVIEKHYHGEQFVRYGRILAAAYEGRKSTHRAFWYRPTGSKEGRYYLEDGRSAARSFLATPVEYTRISSRFNKRRRHPILGFTKAHNGTDYAAPRGTPVRSMADGIVRYAGWRGASGRLVVVEHENGLKSYYAHLHRIQPGIKAGKRISQKQQLGTVGSTGRATGPHLHLGIKRNGKWVDPQKLKMKRRGEGLPAREKKAFEQLVARRLERLESLPTPAGRRPSGGGGAVAIARSDP
ncbi:MAG: M23 family metallopeptidase [Acidobacteriota bacterium]